MVYIKLSENIFTKSTFGLLKSKFEIKKLDSYLKELFKEAKMQDAKTNLIIPTTNIIFSKIKIYKKGGLNGENCDNMLIKDILLASCAAPVYFNPIQTKAKELLADGGLWANNPSLVALIDILRNKELTDLKNDVKILSIGTGESTNFYKMNQKNWGLFNWGKKLIDLIINLNQIMLIIL